ncbi:CoA-acylating methylmalonate-semialdehyde dehydrogenase [Inhella proteolytica]|uniref:CoA-acylating methylmalonate-semialdehyde dehydrogenase n=1 Tax=Inhella proteolytica TaxID=2795029 RepID=UPI0028739136|nr:CoA-acylating methylmalonate-semialdehyde dehydrogenase [Inhella proteolytica]
MIPEVYTDPHPVAHHIAGQAVLAGPLAPVHNPATGQVARWVHQAEGPQIVQAVAAAVAAQRPWGEMPVAQRARVLQRFLHLAQGAGRELAQRIGSEQGKTLDDALGEVRRALEFVEFACAAPALLGGRYSAQAATGLDHWTQPQPLGVTVGVTASSCPFMLPLWMAPLALVCGNSFILKPSPLAPSAALWIAEALREAGLPPGVFQVLQGGAETVNGLICHPEVAALSFVGRSSVARSLYARGAELGKRVQALGSAKNHLVVLPDADLDAACEALVGAAFGSAGQRCMAVSVALLVGHTADALIPRLMDRARNLRVGPGWQEGVELGPLSSAEAMARVERLIGCGAEDGARLLVDGRGLRVRGHEGGFFVGATLIDEVQPWMRIYQEEVFGPVLLCLRVPDLEAAQALIAAHPLAQAAVLYTRSGAAARRFVQQVPVGAVGINVPLPQPLAWMGFGGWKGSLYGEPAAYGPEAFHFYTRQKAVLQRWEPAPAGAAFVFPGAR